MCNAYPGTRCWKDTDDKYREKIQDADTTKKQYGEDSYEYSLASERVSIAEQRRDATKEGISRLKNLIETENNVAPYRARLANAERTYAMQTNAAAEIRNGRVKLISTLAPNPDGYFSQDELDSIVEAQREFKERMAHKYGSTPVVRTTPKTYQAFCDDIAYRLRQEHKGKIPAAQKEALAELRKMDVPDSVSLGAYKDMENAVAKSRKALTEEITKIAALQNVDRATAERFYDGYRNQYVKEFAHLDPQDQPNPPKHWVKGEFKFAGYKKDFNSSFAPSDPASMYAVFRLRSDPNAIPGKYKTVKEIASIDLETAGPSGKEGLQPQNGRIIEVGVVSYDPVTKQETGRYEQLIKPEHLFLKKHGTGAEDVHHISVQDLEDKPAWATVKNDTVKALEGKVLLAQNSNYETTWLQYHGDPVFMSSLPVIDTYDMAKKHLDLPNHKLASICKNVGVAYTDGHRATHDARVTGEAYFKLLKKIEREWRKKPARAKAPALKTVPELTRRLSI